MEQHSCEAADALVMLIDCAYRTRVGIGEVAAAVILTSRLPLDL